MFDLKVGPLVAGMVKGAIKDDRYDFLGDLVGDLVDEVPDIIDDVERSSGLDGEEKFQLVLGRAAVVRIPRLTRTAARLKALGAS